METTVWCLVRVNGLLCQITQTPKVHDICTFLQCLFVCLFFWFFFFGGGAFRSLNCLCFTLVCEGHFMLGYYEDYKWSRTVLTFDCLAYNVGLHGFCFYLSLHTLNTSSITIKFLQSFAGYAGVLAITN